MNKTARQWPVYRFVVGTELNWKCSFGVVLIRSYHYMVIIYAFEVTTFDGMTPAANVSVHGLLVSVPHIKKGHNSECFDGSITDGDCKLDL